MMTRRGWLGAIAAAAGLIRPVRAAVGRRCKPLVDTPAFTFPNRPLMPRSVAFFESTASGAGDHLRRTYLNSQCGQMLQISKEMLDDDAFGLFTRRQPITFDSAWADCERSRPMWERALREDNARREELESRGT